MEAIATVYTDKRLAANIGQQAVAAIRRGHTAGAGGAGAGGTGGSGATAAVELDRSTAYGHSDGGGVGAAAHTEHRGSAIAVGGGKGGAAWEEGAKVDVRYGGGVRWYIGVVAKTHADGSYDIDYDDGDKERRVGYAAIRSRGGGQ
jgi:hypothetical protein